MNNRKGIIKAVLIFTLVMSVGMLAYMLISAYFGSKNKMVIDVDSVELVQLDEINDGAPIAVVDTSLGEIRFVLYPEYSPNAVENFIKLAESGTYNNTYVFHSESGAYSAAGSPNKDGTLGDDYDKNTELVERELNQNLWPFKGAVCSLTSTVDKSFLESVFGGGTYYCGSRFALINTIEFTDEIKEELRASSEGSEKIAEAFIENGGIPNFSQQMTVIGQVYQGIDIVEQLSQLEVEESEEGTYKIPKEDIMINSVTISEYSSKEDNVKNNN